MGGQAELSSLPIRFKNLNQLLQNGCPQVASHQAEVGQEGQTKSASTAVGAHEDWKYHPLQRQASSLAQDQAQLLDWREAPQFISLDKHACLFTCVNHVTE